MTLTNCRQCGYLNREQARFCANCQSNLAAVCLQCGHSLRAPARFCAKCGGQAPELCLSCGYANKPEARFCRQCGRSLSGNLAGVSCSFCNITNRPTAKFCRQCRRQLFPPAIATIECVYCNWKNPADAPFCQKCHRFLTLLQPPQRQYRTGQLPANSSVCSDEGNEYIVIRIVATGGMGAVYQVVRTQDNTLWALKEMGKSQFQPNELVEAIQAFHQEANILKRLNHPNIPQVVDIFEYNGRHYMVMDYIKGKTLHDILQENQRPLPEADVLNWAEQICQVLHLLHQQTPPIIYRDMKPENVMLESDTDLIKVIDFGIARRFKGTKTRDTTLLGTPGYAPAEQYGSGESDERSDVYALGATLHHLLTGRDPSINPFAFDPARKINPKISTRVSKALERATQQEVKRRYQSIAEMYADLFARPIPEQKGRPPASSYSEQKAKKKKLSAPTSQPKRAIHSQANGGLKTSPPAKVVDFGLAPKGPPARQIVPVKVSGYFSVVSESDWLEVKPDYVDDQTQEIELIAHTSRMSLGRQWRQLGSRSANSNLLEFALKWIFWPAWFIVPATAQHVGAARVGTEVIRVYVRLEPTKEQIYWGWIITVILFVIQVVVIGAFLFFLLLLGILFVA